jgi:hypothetical protein
MNTEKHAQWLCRITAIINWSISIPAIVNPVGVAAFYGARVNYPFLVRLINGWVFMFGCMFWETGRELRRKSVLFKYNWIEKSIVATVVTAAYFAGEAPARLMISVILTNWLWIPVILYYDVAVRRLMRSDAIARGRVS